MKCLHCQETARRAYARGLCRRCYRRHRGRYPRLNGTYHVFTAREIQQIRDWRSQVPPVAWKEIRRRLDYQGDWHRLANVTRRHDIPTARKGSCDLDRLRELHEQGHSDPEKARQLGVSIATVSRHRRLLGLEPHCNQSEHARRKCRQRQRLSMQEAGFASVADMVRQTQRLAAARAGWPQAETTGEARILSLLHQVGPRTLDQLKEGLGLSLRSRQGYTWQILERLKRRGLVIMYRDKSITGDGRRQLYRLADGVAPFRPEGRRVKTDRPRTVREPARHKVAAEK